jgi:hypothetical protein
MDDTQKKFLLVGLAGLGVYLYFASKPKEPASGGAPPDALGAGGLANAEPGLALGEDTTQESEPPPPPEPADVITDPKTLSSFDRKNPRHVQRFQQAMNAIIDKILYNKVDTVSKGPLMFITLNPGRGDRKNVDNYDGRWGRNTQGALNSLSGFMKSAIKQAKTPAFIKSKKNAWLINAIEAVGEPPFFGSSEYEDKLAKALINAAGITNVAEYLTAPRISTTDIAIFKSLMTERAKAKSISDSFSGFL